ncbi:MAG: thermonuclease family protein [Parvularculaceae bacterium]|nr:thermonuclease family protein [Parvularculaceae bacterium]
MVAKRSLTLLILVIFASQASARDLSGPVDAVVERIVDGDTVRVSARIWVDQYVSVSVRLKDVDAPELFRPQCSAEKEKARAAKIFVEALVGGGDVVLRDVTHDKYGGRVAAHLETASGADVGAALLAEGLAVSMGESDPWCD